MGENGLRGSHIGSRLFRDLGGRRRRPAAVVAGHGGACVEIRGASSLPSKRVSDHPRWNTCRKSPKVCGRRGRCVGMAPCPMPQHCQATTGGLEHAAPLERDRGTVRSAEPALGAAIGRLSLAAAAAAQEQASPGARWLGSADRDLRNGLSRRRSRPRDPPLGVRVRRAPPRRSGGVGVGRLTDEPPAPHDPRDGEGPILRATDRRDAVEEKALTPQSINRQAALRHGGVIAGGVFGARTSRRISHRGGAARDRAT
jgi:hypothetical protein